MRQRFVFFNLRKDVTEYAYCHKYENLLNLKGRGELHGIGFITIVSAKGNFLNHSSLLSDILPESFYS